MEKDKFSQIQLCRKGKGCKFQRKNIMLGNDIPSKNCGKEQEFELFQKNCEKYKFSLFSQIKNVVQGEF